MITSLPHRKLIRFSGPEAVDFLNDLITASVPSSKEEGLRAAALLTPQGRILFDFLISRDGDDVMIELDEARRDDFIKKMMMYRLRRNVEITADDRLVHAFFDHETLHEMALRDTRFKAGTYRLYHDTPMADNAAEEWKAYRYLQGVAEGYLELPPEKALPLEARLDLDGGINFEKGCYIGQEVTARTRYRGLVKRCYMPVTLTLSIETPADITAEGKPVGEVFDCVTINNKTIAMAAIRLDALDAIGASQNTNLTAAGSDITPLYPERLLPLPTRKK